MKNKNKAILTFLLSIISFTFLSYPVYATTGWKSDGDSWYYYDDNNTKHHGWLFDNGHWYYFKEKNYDKLNDGLMISNTSTGGPDSNYAFDSNGRWIDKTGWYCKSPTNKYGISMWYYIDSDYTTHKGWLYDNGHWYFFTGDRYIMPGQQLYKVLYETQGIDANIFITHLKPIGVEKLLKTHYFDDSARLIYTKDAFTNKITYYN